MGKAKKIIIGVVVTALVGTGIGGGLLYVRKRKPEGSAGGKRQ